MKKTITDLIQIDTSLATPVYKQIIQSIYRDIDNGILEKDDVQAALLYASLRIKNTVIINAA